MHSKKQRIKPALLILCCLLLSMTLTACGNYGKLDEGDCKCIVQLTDIPKEFTMMEENLMEDLVIKVVLKNTITEKQYRIELTQENNYSMEISLHPATYDVYYVSNNMTYYNRLEFAADKENITLTPDTTGEVSITIANGENFTQYWMEVQPMPEIILADKFSRLIQVNRKVINISDILPELELSYDYPVNSYQKITLSDSSKGISVTLLNNTEEQQSWEDCEVIGINVYGNSAVFPEAVTLGMAPEKVLHKTDGLYGEADSFTGTLFYGWDIDNTRAIYHDPSSGDKITVTVNPDGTYITQISYEFAVFE